MGSIVNMLMTRNVGNFDRILRALPAVATAWLWWRGLIDGGPLAALAIISAILLITSLLGSCSIYYMLGWSTCPASGKPRS